MISSNFARRSVFAAVIALVVSASAPAATAQTCPRSEAERPWLDTSLSAECRADALVASMGSIEEKLAAVSGSLSRYGVHDVQMGDGPAGPTRSPFGPPSGADSLALPNPLSLAAGFDEDLAAEYGTVIGRENRALGRQHMLGPSMDMARTWRHGRTPESYGEDPFLVSRMAARVVRAIQAEGVAVTLKHYAVYAQEQGRIGDMPMGQRPAVNNVLSERVMREIYLPAFRAAVEEGGALNAMCSFPRINGEYACQHTQLLGILKNEFGMRGVVMPDFPDAQRSVIEAVNAGLDTGHFGLVPYPRLAAFGVDQPPGGIDLRTAVRDGRVSEARIDDMIRRRLIARFAVGAGAEPPTPRGAVADERARALALRAVTGGAVLLRNHNDALPLAGVRSIAVIGAQGGEDPQVTTPGSAFVQATRVVTALDAIRARAGEGVAVTYAPGNWPLDPLPQIGADVLRAPNGEPGLLASYHENRNLDFATPALLQRVEAGVNIVGPDVAPGLPVALNGWSAVWTGSLTPRQTGLHELSIQGAGTGRLFINGELVARFEKVDFGVIQHAAVSLEAGRPVDVRVEFTPRDAATMPLTQIMGTTIGLGMRLGWAEPDGRLEQAVAAARAADVAIVFAADRNGEGADRLTLALPGVQDALIGAVAAANPRTIVVLSTSGPVTMPWLNDVEAVLQTWYAGDAFGDATAQLLFGDAEPRGRLPITFPRSDGQGPATEQRTYPGLFDADGAIDAAYFDEGLNIGYRWFDEHRERPLFPFGFGLGYSSTAIDRVTVAQEGESVRVRARVRNTGDRPTSETVQIYAALPSSAGEPPKRLVGFRRVDVAVGASVDVDIVVPRLALEIWDSEWRLASGRYEFMVGRSSGDIVARRSVRL